MKKENLQNTVLCEAWANGLHSPWSCPPLRPFKSFWMPLTVEPCPKSLRYDPVLAAVVPGRCEQKTGVGTCRESPRYLAMLWCVEC